MVMIRRRRRDANRLGFAVHLAYLRFPGRVIGVDENPPLDMLCFIAEQIGVAIAISKITQRAYKLPGLI
jgi:TnpA family transposase